MILGNGTMSNKCISIKTKTTNKIVLKKRENFTQAMSFSFYPSKNES